MLHHPFPSSSLSYPFLFGLSPPVLLFLAFSFFCLLTTPACTWYGLHRFGTGRNRASKNKTEIFGRNRVEDNTAYHQGQA
jgi:hypothetical protein